MKAWKVQSVLRVRVTEVYPLPWKAVSAGAHVKHKDDPHARLFRSEDACIVDAQGYEVLGASEWLRCDVGVLQWIVQTVNQGRV